MLNKLSSDVYKYFAFGCLLPVAHSVDTAEELSMPGAPHSDASVPLGKLSSVKVPYKA